MNRSRFRSSRSAYSSRRTGRDGSANGSSGHRRQIEVYFILYLAAVLFLLPDTNEKKQTAESDVVLKLLSSQFFIKPEKQTLNCQILTVNAPLSSVSNPANTSTNGSTTGAATNTGTSAGASMVTSMITSIVQLDSVNAIAFSGDYTDVHYEFFVEDATLRQTVVAMSAQQSMNSERQGARMGAFRMEEDSRRGVANFIWQPDLRDRRNRTFTVRVLATARPVVPASISDPALRAKLQAIISQAGRVDTATTSFTINIFSIGSNAGVIATNDSIGNNLANGSAGGLQGGANGGQNGAGASALNPSSPSVVSNLGGVRTVFRLPPDYRPPPPGDFALLPQNQAIEALPMQQWNNNVLVSGEVNLRSNAPQVNVIKSDINDTQGSAFLTDVGDNLMQISGIAPSSGVMTVRVVVARAEDNKRVVTEFNVRSSQLQRPTLPQRMYPGITYEFNPNLAFLTGQELRAVLAEPSKDGTRETKERYSSPQGSAFVFTPAEGDAGKTLVFERYINGRRVGEVYTVPVEDFAGPEVLEITPQSRILLVRTKCSGMVRGDMNRVTFDASKLSNAIVAERFGDIIRNESLQETIQLFEIRRAEPDKPVTGAFRVVDKKNRASAVKSAER